MYSSTVAMPHTSKLYNNKQQKLTWSKLVLVLIWSWTSWYPEVFSISSIEKQVENPSKTKTLQQLKSLNLQMFSILPCLHLMFSAHFQCNLSLSPALVQFAPAEFCHSSTPVHWTNPPAAWRHTVLHSTNLLCKLHQRTLLLISALFKTQR